MTHPPRHATLVAPFACFPSPALILLPLAAILAGCGRTPGSGTEDEAAAMGVALDASLDRAVLQYTAMDEALPDTLFPRTTGTDGTLLTNESGWWTSGFFPGSLWYLHEYSGDPELRTRALARTWAVEREKQNAGDHDIGFKIFNSFGHAWRLTGDSTLIPVLLTAAQTLSTRFDPRVGAIRSWGAHPDTTAPYLVIIDNMMNLELLFWAARESGDASFFEIAVSHADKTLEHHFRPDGSSYHVLEYDPNTGEVLRKRTQQGYSDASAWARGQAWGLYGYTVAYREAGLSRYLEQAKAIAGFILGHPNFPDDGVPYWDFDAPGIPDTHRDASAGAIMASALLELSAFVEDSLRAAYRDAAMTILRTLSSPRYRAEPGENAHFLLRHGVGSLPQESEVDVPLSYADYYYLEAALRLRVLLDGSSPSVGVVPVGTGWARTSVNAVIFRQHGLVTRDSTQYAALYDTDGRMLLARRTLGKTDWEIHRTPQCHLVWHDGTEWRASPIGRRTGAFTLAGGGTRRIPLSRPLVLARPGDAVYVVFREFQRGGGISLATSTDPARDDWRIRELYEPSVGLWEPDSFLTG